MRKKYKKQEHFRFTEKQLTKLFDLFNEIVVFSLTTENSKRIFSIIKHLPDEALKQLVEKNIPILKLRALLILRSK